MHHHVALQEVVFAEAPGAVRTPVRPGPTVDKHVTFQIARSWETFVAQSALVRFVLEMSVNHSFLSAHEESDVHEI